MKSLEQIVIQNAIEINKITREAIEEHDRKDICEGRKVALIILPIAVILGILILGWMGIIKF